MDQLDVEIAAFNRMRDYLEANHMWEWVIIDNEELIGTFEDFQVAAQTAVKLFGGRPCLLRQVGRPPFQLPPFSLVQRVHADD